MLEENIKAEVCRQHEASAVIGIVTHEEVGHGRLRRGRLQRRMGIDDAGRRVEAGIGDSPNTNLSIVVGDMLQQKLDGVIHVGTVKMVDAEIERPVDQGHTGLVVAVAVDAR